MDDTEIKKRAEEEQDRITKILKDTGISERRMQMLAPVILNTSWMKAKLDDAREAIKNTSVAIPYDNGGNQKGIRVNPLFTGYESLWKAYMNGMTRILDSLPKEEITQNASVVETPKTMLELVRNKHKKDA